MLSIKTKSILGEIGIGEKFEGNVKLLSFRKLEIPILKKIVYVYYFETLSEKNILKSIVTKKRNSLKGLEIGDIMKISATVKDKYGRKKYLVENLRIKNNSIY